MKEIPLTQGKVALVDDADYKQLILYRWRVAKQRHTWYAYCRKISQYMHRVIMQPPEGFFVDHINHNGLDNQRKNLRLCTTRQNLRNQRKWKAASSRFKGVSWDKVHNCWQSFIWVSGRNKRIGVFENEIEAAKAYDEAAKRYFGIFACLNF